MLQSRKKNTNQPGDKIMLFFRKNSFINEVLQAVRNLRTNRNGKGTKKSSRFAIFKNINTVRIIILILVVGFLVVAFLHIYKYLGLKTVTYVQSDQSAVLRPIYDDSKEINVVYLGFDDKKPGYKFLDFVVINSVNTKTGSIKSYGINPYFQTNVDDNAVTLRATFNTMQDASENKMNELMNKIENIVGIRIDRYIAFNYSDFGKIIDLENPKMDAVNPKETDQGFVNSGDSLQGGKLLDYLINNSVVDDSVMRRYVNFTNDFLEDFKDNLKLYRLFWNSDKFLNLVYTDFSREDLFKYIVAINNADFPAKNGFLSTTFTNDKVDKIEDGIKKSDLIIDEDVVNVFNSIPIIQEQAKIEVYNATDQSGLAYIRQRFYQNQGATIVKYGNYPESSNDNTLYIPKSNSDQFVNTIQMIRTDLRDNVKIVLGDYKYNYTGDLILVLGK